MKQKIDMTSSIMAAHVPLVLALSIATVTPMQMFNNYNSN
jgi:hypothetical protein